jgi:hypothetical protein
MLNLFSFYKRIYNCLKNQSFLKVQLQNNGGCLESLLETAARVRVGRWGLIHIYGLAGHRVGGH